MTSNSLIASSDPVDSAEGCAIHGPPSAFHCQGVCPGESLHSGFQKLSAMLWDSHRRAFLQGRGAATYHTEVTCLLVVKPNHVDTLLGQGARSGSPGMRRLPMATTCVQGGQWQSGLPSWLHCCAGRRWWFHVFCCFGSAWVCDFRAWASFERGFLDISAIKRQGRKAWFMRARPPPSLSVDSGVTMAVASGISVNLACGTITKVSAPSARPRSSWSLGGLCENPDGESAPNAVKRDLSPSGC